jgi:hypothetical protein
MPFEYFDTIGLEKRCRAAIMEADRRTGGRTPASRSHHKGRDMAARRREWPGDRQ